MWKELEEGYNFALDLISIGGLHIKLWGPKVAGVSTLGISKFPNGSPETKCHLDVNFMGMHTIFYKGKVVAPPSPGCDESCEFDFTRDSS
jgi:hypothetical protein